jgi:glycosyltransferase involved in cell wall biosynthesis
VVVAAGVARPRVLHLIATMQVGGAERFCVDLARALGESGLVTGICAMYGDGPFGQVAAAGGVTLSTVRRRFRYDPVALGALVRRLRRLAPDIVHVHDVAGLLYGAPAAWLARQRVAVATRHDVYSAGAWRDALAARIQSRIPSVVASSPAVAERIERVSGRACQVIPCGIDRRRFRYRDPRPARAPHVMTIGRLESQKGQAHLLDAFARVLRARPGARLSIVGAGSAVPPCGRRRDWRCSRPRRPACP